jgi:hypothetical protein
MPNCQSSAKSVFGAICQSYITPVFDVMHVSMLCQSCIMPVFDVMHVSMLCQSCIMPVFDVMHVSMLCQSCIMTVFDVRRFRCYACFEVMHFEVVTFRGYGNSVL